MAEIVNNLNRPPDIATTADSSTTPPLVEIEPVVTFECKPSSISLSKNYLPGFDEGSSESVFATVESESESSERNSGYFEITGDFDGFFSIREKYLYDSGEFMECKTYVVPGNLESLDEILELTASFFESDKFLSRTVNGYEYRGDKSLLFPDIKKYSQKRAYSLARAEKDRLDRLAEEEGLVAPITEPFILETSEDTLKMSKYTMRVKVGETKQICIALCPKGYEDKLIFMTDNKSAAIVDENGNVTGVKNGSATITVTVDGAAGYSSVMIYVY